MSFVVKNTTRCGLLDLLCPHSCRGCGRLGEVLCERCKNDILRKRQPICPLCKQILTNVKTEHCESCQMPLAEVRVVGFREGPMKKLVAEYKYETVWAIGDVLAELVAEIMPKDWQDVIVVPLPTIGRHVRERGFDHTERLAKKIAKIRHWQCQRILARAVDTVQVGAKAAERQEQAEKAYISIRSVRVDKKYLLIDDVWTTGASALEAANVMQKAGAKDINIAVIVTGR